MITLFLFIGFGANAQFKSATYSEVISKQKKGSLSTYIAESGESFSVGDSLTLGPAFRNENYDYIIQNAGVAFYPLPNMASGSKVVIKKIKVQSKLVRVVTTRPQGYVYSLWIINMDGAVKNGEVVSRLMSSDQALAELKKWKSKLDLEIITQEEYDAKKNKLINIINN